MWTRVEEEEEEEEERNQNKKIRIGGKEDRDQKRREEKVGTRKEEENGIGSCPTTGTCNKTCHCWRQPFLHYGDYSTGPSCTNPVASFPGPTQPSVACSMEKLKRAWYLFSHEQHQDRKDGRKGLIFHGCTGPRTAESWLGPGNEAINPV